MGSKPAHKSYDSITNSGAFSNSASSSVGSYEPPKLTFTEMRRRCTHPVIAGPGINTRRSEAGVTSRDTRKGLELHYTYETGKPYATYEWEFKPEEKRLRSLGEYIIHHNNDNSRLTPTSRTKSGGTFIDNNPQSQDMNGISAIAVCAEEVE